MVGVKAYSRRNALRRVNKDGTQMKVPRTNVIFTTPSANIIRSPGTFQERYGGGEGVQQPTDRPTYGQEKRSLGEGAGRF